MTSKGEAAASLFFLVVAAMRDVSAVRLRGIEGRRPAAHRRAAPGTAIWLGYAQSLDLTRIWLA
ncbi:hypothetical protein LY56_02961 [Roseinatronobacter thiooxidans]|uniref:Uncharacterized protein n=1 Tax=Roseinatronobacter thiooxidans TaxID=121821 RepID=A0A2W7PU28_9RHOB|nr:hypothetical protein LY56_02961 [Roseinatronobacter thiooxidans]